MGEIDSGRRNGRRGGSAAAVYLSQGSGIDVSDGRIVTVRRLEGEHVEAYGHAMACVLSPILGNPDGFRDVEGDSPTLDPLLIYQLTDIDVGMPLGYAAAVTDDDVVSLEGAEPQIKAFLAFLRMVLESNIASETEGCLPLQSAIGSFLGKGMPKISNGEISVARVCGAVLGSFIDVVRDMSLTARGKATPATIRSGLIESFRFILRRELLKWKLNQECGPSGSCRFRQSAAFMVLQGAFGVTPDQHDALCVRHRLTLGHQHALRHLVRLSQRALREDAIHPHDAFPSDEAYEAWYKRTSADLDSLLARASDGPDAEPSFIGTIFIGVLGASVRPLASGYSPLKHCRGSNPDEWLIEGTDDLCDYQAIAESFGDHGVAVDVPYPTSLLEICLWDSSAARDDLLRAAAFNPWAKMRAMKNADEEIVPHLRSVSPVRDRQQAPKDSASTPSYLGTVKLDLDQVPSEMQAGETCDWFVLEGEPDLGPRDEAKWHVRLVIRFIRNAFLPAKLPNHYTMHELLANRLISYELAKSRDALRADSFPLNGQEKTAINVGDAAAAVNVVSGGEGEGVYPGPMSHASLSIIAEHATRFGVSKAHSLLCLLRALADAEGSGLVAVSVFQVHVQNVLDREVVKGRFTSLTIGEETRLVEVVEDVLDVQLRRLLSYKQSFPGGMPEGPLRDAISYLGFALGQDLLRKRYVRAYPAVDQLLLECTKDATEAVYKNCATHAAVRRKSKGQQTMGLGDTQYMLNLITLVTNEIAEDESCFASVWPFDLLAVTVPLHLQLLAADFAAHFKKVTHVDGSPRVLDLYLKLKDLRRQYKTHWDAIDGDTLFSMTEWFLPSVFSWLDSSVSTLGTAASAMVDSDPLTAESSVDRHSTSVGELFLMLHQNINFLVKLEFTDERLHAILLLKFVQSTQQVVRKLLDNLADRMDSLTEQNHGKALPSTMRKMCVCCNNTIGARKQMYDLCAVMGVNGDVFSAESGAQALRAANENGDDTLSALLLATRKSLDLATKTSIDKLAESASSALVAPVVSFIQTLNTSQKEPTSPIKEKSRTRALFSRWQGSSPKSKARQAKGTAYSSENTAPVDPQAEADQLTTTACTNASAFADVIQDTLYESLQQDAYLQIWKRTISALTLAVLQPIALPDQVIGCVRSIMKGLHETLVGAGRLPQNEVDLDGQYSYLERCIGDLQAPTASLVQRYREIMGKQLRENEDITAYLNSQEQVQHIPALLALRPNDIYASEFVRSVGSS